VYFTSEAEWYSIPLSSKNGIVQSRKIRIVNEAGLYRLVFKSHKDEAEKFRTWVFEEVLPSIRKYGLYRASRPRTWSFKGEEELTWAEWMEKQEKDFFKKHPSATYEDFFNQLPNR